MRFSLELPVGRVDEPDEFVTAQAVTEMARAAEAAGFDAVFVTDHPAPSDKWLAHGGHHALEPVVALSFAAAATSTLRLHTHIYVLGYRNPFLSARALGSLDALAGGRLIVGTAAGYLRPEFAALGVDFDERNELLDEAIDLVKLAWTTEGVEYQGRHFEARGTTLLPHPATDPHPPIWCGGNSQAAMRRAVDRCQGWAPFPTSPVLAQTAKTASIENLDDLEAALGRLHDYRSRVGSTGEFDVCFGPFSMMSYAADPARLDDVGSEVETLAGLGVTWVTVHVPQRDRDQWLEETARFGRQVIGPGGG